MVLAVPSSSLSLLPVLLFDDFALGGGFCCCAFIVSSSRGITYAAGDPDISRDAFARSVREKTLRMVEEVNSAVKMSMAT